jgi:hypothetical protein
MVKFLSRGKPQFFTGKFGKFRLILNFEIFAKSQKKRGSYKLPLIREAPSLPLSLQSFIE